MSDISQLSTDHLIGIKQITADDIQLIFETANNFKEVINRPIKKVPSLRDITIANLFLKIPLEQDCLLNLPKNDSQQIPSISQPLPLL
jgi:hypothetical protein